MHQSTKEAFKNSGLNERDVTPFMRLIVVWLTTKLVRRSVTPRKSLLPISNSTEQQMITSAPCSIYYYVNLSHRFSLFCRLFLFSDSFEFH